jgi:hypothetical protein
MGPPKPKGANFPDTRTWNSGSTSGDGSRGSLGGATGEAGPRMQCGTMQMSFVIKIKIGPPGERCA